MSNDPEAGDRSPIIGSDPFDRPEWIGKETSSGVTEMERPWPHVTYEQQHSNVHFHYWQTDEDLDQRGYGVADIVCHGCQQATRVTFPADVVENALLPLREAFVKEHRSHGAIGGEFLCPPHYHITERVDLR